MGLTSHELLTLALMAALGAVVGTVLYWPRLARPGLPAVLGRITTILVTQLAVLVVVGLLVNNYFSFYSSWSDLLGTGHPAVQSVGASTPGGGSSAPATARTLATENFQNGPPQRTGQLLTVRIGGGGTGLSTDGYVYLPPQYFQPGYAQQRFPALVVLTGYPGDARNLVTRLDYPGISLGLLRSGQQQPTVLVMLRSSPAMPRDTECEDVPGGPQAATYFTHEVPQAVAGAFRVIGQGRGWGIIGDSTGGYCALKLAMRDPAAFAAAASLSGYFKAAEDPTTGDLFAGDQQRRNEADLLWRLHNLPPPAVAELLAYSKDDPASVRDSVAFAAAVRPPMAVSVSTVDHGGHNFETWTRLEPTALSWLSEHLAKPG
ncbi:enterochelin esterase-like enzyme [Kitasatospora sp. GP30]|uniref:alpha/beta hydrolase n=1 Tax=Kitasatospora sp. GP30 TaxID=3035084 RepID=UPI000C70374F|nr:alpha/beta hydrolase-fold protein [Kitasatospora sp. GP30]MDH6145947.1 enterochelin esterase-like enzyme [Kitasatospora sp. GP30]